MNAAMPYLIAGAALAVLFVLALGLVNMFRTNADPRRANRLMQWRVGLQFLAVVLLVLFLLLVKG